MAQTRAEHLEWAKGRALDYLPDTNNAMASFLSDLNKHEETAGHPVGELFLMLAMSGLLSEGNCRDLIAGTN